jgi:iron complex transport system ATP-binding protein
MLKAEHISCRIGDKQILDDVSVSFAPGKFNMILGPNGSGKSTFLKIFSGEFHSYNGDVFYNGVKLGQLKKPELSRRRAVMSQQPELNFPLMVEEVVMMGRYPHFDFNPGKKDEKICGEVMELLKLESFRERNYLTLSGGEKQRVQFARVLAQIWEKPLAGSRYLIMDEPLTSLDLSYQHEFLSVARALLKEETVLIAIIHDINLAIQYADRLFFLKAGRLVAHGEAAETISEPLINQVFGIHSTIVKNPVTGLPLVIYSK